VDLAELSARKEFLGAEFLLWLWYRAEEFDGAFTIDGGHVELGFDDQLVLESDLQEAEQSRLKGGAPAYSPEAHKALQVGKRVRRAKLRLLKGEREWAFLFDATTFHTSGVKLPAVLSEHDDDRFFERMYLIEELDGAIHTLYRQFLELRLGDRWDTEHAAIKHWIAAPTADEP